MNSRQNGFTLIEIAIVLVIIGLLLGGVLKGQELITGARVRNLASQQDGVKAAYFGFLDRYRALPGDYASATTNITFPAPPAACGGGNGNGNGQIQSAANQEHLLVWQHLTAAGFINGTYTCAAGAATTGTSPANPYGGLLDMQFDAVYAPAASSARHNLKTGGSVPSDILAEVDRKVDDGNPTTGSFRVTGAHLATPAAVDAACAGAAWLTTGTNCNGATLF